MKIEEMYAELDKNLETAISSAADYVKRLVESEESALHLAERLNAELPPRFEDLQRSFIANLQSRLGEIGEEFVSQLDAKARIKYYDAEIERATTKDIRCSSWSEWSPVLVPKIQTAAGGCAILGGVGAGLVFAKSLGVLPIKIPILFGSLTTTVISCLAFTCAATAVAIRPDELPLVLDQERKHAQNHAFSQLTILRRELTQAVRRAGEGAMAELENLKMPQNSASSSL